LEIYYRQAFLRDIKKLKKQPVYDEIFDFVFTTLPNIRTLRELSDIKAMKSYPNRYRIRIGDYRIGIETHGEIIEIVRVLHRREFYRYFP